MERILRRKRLLRKLWLHHRWFSAPTSGLKECITPLWPMFTMYCLDSELKASVVYRLSSWTGDTWRWSNKAVDQRKLASLTANMRQNLVAQSTSSFWSHSLSKAKATVHFYTEECNIENRWPCPIFFFCEPCCLFLLFFFSSTRWSILVHLRNSVVLLRPQWWELLSVR